MRVITIPDIRWARPDIKSVALLPNALGKQQAKEAGAYEAWQVDRDGNVTEGTSSNAWIVTAAGEMVTRQADRAILNGVTRTGLLPCHGRRRACASCERPFTVAEAKAARRGFLTSASNFLIPGRAHRRRRRSATARPGPLTRRLIAGLCRLCRRAAARIGR